MKTSRQEDSVAVLLLICSWYRLSSWKCIFVLWDDKTMLGESNIVPFSGFLQSGRNEESSFEYSRLDDKK